MLKKVCAREFMALVRLLQVLANEQSPTDGVRDYASQVDREMSEQGVVSQTVSLNWKSEGWSRAKSSLRGSITLSSPDWILFHFNPLMWSSRGVPWRALSLVRILNATGAGIAAMFHDPPWTGDRIRDRIRHEIQVMLMRSLSNRVSRSIVTIPPDNLNWPKDPSGLCFIPVGANILPVARRNPSSRAGTLQVAVFGVTPGHFEEVINVERAIRAAVEIPLSLSLIGKGSEWAKQMLEDRGQLPRNIHIEASGISSLERISELLATSDVLLYVRGHVSSRRTTVIAAMAHELPIVGFLGQETGWPVTEGGVALCSYGSFEEVGRLLSRLHRDEAWSNELRKRSAQAFEQHFSWQTICARLRECLMGSEQVINEVS